MRRDPIGTISLARLLKKNGYDYSDCPVAVNYIEKHKNAPGGLFTLIRFHYIVPIERKEEALDFIKKIPGLGETVSLTDFLRLNGYRSTDRSVVAGFLAQNLEECSTHGFISRYGNYSVVTAKTAEALKIIEQIPGIDRIPILNKKTSQTLSEDSKKNSLVDLTRVFPDRALHSYQAKDFFFRLGQLMQAGKLQKILVDNYDRTERGFYDNPGVRQELQKIELQLEEERKRERNVLSLESIAKPYNLNCRGIKKVRSEIDKLRITEDILIKNSRACGKGGFTYHDVPDVRTLVNQILKETIRDVQYVKCSGEKKQTEVKPSKIEEETKEKIKEPSHEEEIKEEIKEPSHEEEIKKLKEILKRNPGAVGVVPGSDLPIYAKKQALTTSQTNPTLRENWSPDKPYVSPKQEILEWLRKKTTVNERTHFSLVEIMAGDINIAGPFAMMHKDRLGNISGSSSGVVGYDRRKIADIYELWLGDVGKSFREKYPFKRKAKKRGREEKWVSLREIRTEFDIKPEILAVYSKRFGERKQRKDIIGRKETIFRESVVIKVLDELEAKGIIHRSEEEKSDDEREEIIFSVED